MWIYMLVLAIPLVMSFQAPRRRSLQVGLVAYYLLLWLIGGLRHQVGPERPAYGYMYDAAVAHEWNEIANDREPGFFLINKLLDALRWGIYGINAIGAVLFLAACITSRHGRPMRGLHRFLRLAARW